MRNQNWQRKARKFLACSIITEPFHTITISLLSLLLPLSFLLLARISSYNYLLTITTNPAEAAANPSNFFSSLFLHINPAILYALVSVVSVATLIHGLTDKISSLSESSAGGVYRPGLYTAWILLCTLQISVGFGIEGSIAAGVFDGCGFGIEKSMLSRLIFFLGLHETMIHWGRSVVKPVVDDAIFGVARDEMLVQRLTTALCYGTLWWWRLKNEVEALVLVAEAKSRSEVSVGVGVADLVGWWLYYLTVTIGMVRIVKGVIWVGVILLFERVRRNSNDSLDQVEDSKV